MPDGLGMNINPAMLRRMIKENDALARMTGGVGPDYDYSFAETGPDGRGHFTDRGKLPNHPTFSIDSAYAELAPGEAGRWVQTPNGVGYVPGPARMSNPAYIRFMKEKYLPAVDPNVQLITKPIKK